MTWVRIDDDFEDNGKVAPLSDSAHRVWLMANCWCKKPANFHTHGFVPAAMLPEITHHRYKPGQLQKLVQELVNANVGGTKEHGLWEPSEGGWQFHDWQRYLSKDDLALLANGRPKLSRSEAGRIGGKHSVETRRQTNGTAQPKQTSKQSSFASEYASEANVEASPEAPPKHLRSPDPDPVPIQTDRLIQGLESSKQSGAETLRERAAAALKDPYTGEFSTPRQWPEVSAAVDAFCRIHGPRHAKRGAIPRDSGVMALLALFGAGHSGPDVVRAIQLSERDPYCAQHVKGLSNLTLEVVNRLLADSEASPVQSNNPASKTLEQVEAEAELARQNRDKQPVRRPARPPVAPPTAKTRPDPISSVLAIGSTKPPEPEPETKQMDRRAQLAALAALEEANAS